MILKNTSVRKLYVSDFLAQSPEPYYNDSINNRQEASYMTPVYEVKTTHTKQVLKDFITFSEAVQQKNYAFRYTTLVVCNVLLAFLGRDKAGLLITFSALALLTLVFALVRKPIAVSRLANADPNYQNQNVLHFIFGESEFRIDTPVSDTPQTYKYGEIEFMYSDDTYYYININNEDLQMFPKKDFTLGDAEAFYDFMTHKTGKIFLPVKLSWQMKLDILKQAWEHR